MKTGARPRCPGAAGLGLIEMAMVVALSGLLLGAYAQFYGAQIEKQRIETTKKREEDLRQALALYAMTYARLPCPASPTGANPPLVEDGSPADLCAPDAKQAPDGVVVHIDPQNPDQGAHIWIGAVPTRELRLEDEQGRDGWGNLFTYAVTRSLTLPRGMHGNPVPAGAIAVVDQNGVSVLDKPNSGRWVIVSHGPSGGGAWTSQGARRPCPPDTLASKNCDGGGQFVSAPRSLRPGPSFNDNLVIHDNPNAGGNLVDHIVACNAKLSFYAPALPGADQEGCLYAGTARRLPGFYTMR